MKKNIFWIITGKISGKKILIVVKLHGQKIQKHVYKLKKEFNTIYKENILIVKRRVEFSGSTIQNNEILNQECKKVLHELNYLAAPDEMKHLMKKSFDFVNES